jgi:Tol biopolymer transport system component
VSPVWAPNGRKLAFYETRLGAIEILDFTRTLLPIRSEGRTAGEFSPDGGSLVFEDRAGETGGRSQLKVARIESNVVSVQGLVEGQSSDSRPAWSPEGSWIAFVRLSQDGTAGLWVVRPDGTEAHPLHQEAGWLYSRPVWAPDGSAVAFSRAPMRAGGQLYDKEVWIAPIAGPSHRLDVRGEVVAWAP